MQRTLFISDLHLDEDHPAQTAQFLALLQSCDKSVDALYILGDLFESWIGDDNTTPYNQKIITALTTASTNGLPIYFMHGNRDFLIGKRFARLTGCRLLGEEVLISMYGTPVLLMHGDTLCTNDIKYLRARKMAYTPYIRTLFLLLPLFVRRKIAANMRAKSAMHTQVVSNDIMDVVDSEVSARLKKHASHYLIHGHTHKRAIHSIIVDNEPAERIVLGDWHQTGNALVWYADGTKEFIDM